MEGLERGFYTTSKNFERKPESILGQFSSPQPQPFSQSQQPGEEQKIVQKTTHAKIPISQEKPRKQMKSSFPLEVSEFNPSSQMSMEQFIKVLLNLQEEVRKLKKDNGKLMENLKKQEEIESDSCPRKEIQMFHKHFIRQKQPILKLAIEAERNWKYNREIEENQHKLQLQIGIREHKSGPMLIKEEIISKLQRKQQQIKIIKRVFVVEAYDIYI